MEKLYHGRFGNTLMLRPKQAKGDSGSLQADVDRALSATETIDQKWKAFQEKFQAVLDASLSAVVRTTHRLALSPTNPLPAALPFSSSSLMR